MRLYLASSWRNKRYPAVLRALRDAGHEVYDFRQSGTAFHWRDIDPDWKTWSPEKLTAILKINPSAQLGFRTDFNAMQRAEAMVLVDPCGRSAHLELGWAAGAGKPTAILLAGGDEPELMYNLAGVLCTTVDQIIDWLSGLDRSTTKRECPGCNGVGHLSWRVIDDGSGYLTHRVINGQCDLCDGSGSIFCKK